jgi:transposase
MRKGVYRIQNWSEYNRALIERGSITVWIEEEAIQKWFSNSSPGRAGRPETYSEESMLMLLVLRERFCLTLRALEGFVKSIFSLMSLGLPVPSYTQICRRAKTLHKKVERLSQKGVRHLIFDSTGLKVYGEGEWKVKVHGKSKRRTWRKFHIGIDAETQDIVLQELTGNNTGDAEVANRLIKSFKGKLKTVRADGAYDARHLREEICRKKGRSIIPPPRNAVYKGAPEGWERERDASIAEIYGLGNDEEARKLWKRLHGYYKRSLVETTMFRIKRMLGERLKARHIDNQRTECFCKSLVINKMNKLGLPKGKWIIEAA